MLLCSLYWQLKTWGKYQNMREPNMLKVGKKDNNMKSMMLSHNEITIMTSHWNFSVTLMALLYSIYWQFWKKLSYGSSFTVAGFDCMFN